MSEETGEIGTRELTLEAVMDRCAAQKRAMVLHDGDYVAFRRGGFVYAFRVNGRDIGLKGMATAEERKEADTLAGRIRAGGISEASFRINGPTDRFCISSSQYRPGHDHGKEYDIPEDAKWVRARKRKIIFYGKGIPEHKENIEDKRRKYHAVPEGAVKLRRNVSRFEWLMPADSGSYEWKRI